MPGRVIRCLNRSRECTIQRQKDGTESHSSAPAPVPRMAQRHNAHRDGEVSGICRSIHNLQRSFVTAYAAAYTAECHALHESIATTPVSVGQAQRVRARDTQGRGRQHKKYGICCCMPPAPGAAQYPRRSEVSRHSEDTDSKNETRRRVEARRGGTTAVRNEKGKGSQRKSHVPSRHSEKKAE